MLNFENISFELLEDSIAKSLKTATTIQTIIIVTAIIAFVAGIFYVVKKLVIDGDLSDLGSAIICIICMGIMVTLFILDTTMTISLTLRPYAIANVEVTPTETVTKEFLKQNDNFVEIDGKFYYKETLYQTIDELRKNVKNKDRIGEQLEKSFKEIIDAENSRKWFKENTKTISNNSK